MAGFKALLVVFLVAFANTKIINGLPIEGQENIYDDSDYDYYYGEGKSISNEESTSTYKYYDSTPHAVSMRTQDDDSELENETYEDEESFTEAYDSRTHNVQRRDTSIDKAIVHRYFYITASGEVITADSPGFLDHIGAESSNASLGFNRGLIRGSKKNYWINKPGEIVMVEGNKCTEAIYKRGRRVSSGTLGKWECAEVLEAIEQLIYSLEKSQ